MSIKFTCLCGTKIDLPDEQVGRTLCCPSCGRYFVVPSPVGPRKKKEDKTEQPMDFADEEKVRVYSETHPSILPRAPYYSQELQCWITGYTSEEYMPRSDESPPELMHIEGEADDEEAANQPLRAPRPVSEADQEPSVPMGLHARQKFYWGKLADSLFVVLDPDNLKSFSWLVLLNWILTCLGVWRPDNDPNFYITAYLILFFQLLIFGYLTLFFTNMLLVTGIGEDDLPLVGFSDVWEGLFKQVVKFVCSWAVVLLPAVFTLLALHSEWSSGPFRPRDLLTPAYTPVLVLAGLGVLAWPAIMTILAFNQVGWKVVLNLRPRGLWRLVKVAPRSYLLMGMIAMVTLVGVFFSWERVWLPWYQSWGIDAPHKGPALLALGFAAVRTYLLCLLMRAVGLYYRHFEDRLDWLDEQAPAS